MALTNEQLDRQSISNPTRKRGPESTSIFPRLRVGLPKRREFKTYALGYQDI